MPTRQVFIYGQDISSRVLDFGQIEEIQSARFVTSGLITGETDITVSNVDGAFIPDGPGAFLSRDWNGARVDIYRNGVLVFPGILRNVKPDAGAREVRLTLVNALAVLADGSANYEANGVTPAAAALGVLRSAGLTEFLDIGSFHAAGAAAAANGGMIGVRFQFDSDASPLDALSALSDAFSLSIVCKGVTISCHAYQRRRDASTGLGPAITESNARDIGGIEYEDRDFANRVIVSWGSGQTLEATRKPSTVRYAMTKDTRISGEVTSSLSIRNARAASYFANLALDRLATRRAKLSVVLGPEFESLSIGDRHPITSARLNLNAAPFEAVEVRKASNTDEIRALFVASAEE